MALQQPFTKTLVTNPVAPSSINDPIATHYDTLGGGGWMSVANVSSRNSIPENRRKWGMVVVTISDGAIYMLKNPQMRAGTPPGVTGGFSPESGYPLGWGGTGLTNNSNWIQLFIDSTVGPVGPVGPAGANSSTTGATGATGNTGPTLYVSESANTGTLLYSSGSSALAATNVLLKYTGGKLALGSNTDPAALLHIFKPTQNSVGIGVGTGATAFNYEIGTTAGIFTNTLGSPSANLPSISFTATTVTSPYTGGTFTRVFFSNGIPYAFGYTGSPSGTYVGSNNSFSQKAVFSGANEQNLYDFAGSMRSPSTDRDAVGFSVMPSVGGMMVKIQPFSYTGSGSGSSISGYSGTRYARIFNYGNNTWPTPSNSAVGNAMDDVYSEIGTGSFIYTGLPFNAAGASSFQTVNEFFRGFTGGGAINDLLVVGFGSTYTQQVSTAVYRPNNTFFGLVQSSTGTRSNDFNIVGGPGWNNTRRGQLNFFQAVQLAPVEQRSVSALVANISDWGPFSFNIFSQPSTRYSYGSFYYTNSSSMSSFLVGSMSSTATSSHYALSFGVGRNVQGTGSPSTYPGRVRPITAFGSYITANNDQLAWAFPALKETPIAGLYAGRGIVYESGWENVIGAGVASSYGTVIGGNLSISDITVPAGGDSNKVGNSGNFLNMYRAFSGFATSSTQGYSRMPISVRANSIDVIDTPLSITFSPGAWNVAGNVTNQYYSGLPLVRWGSNSNVTNSLPAGSASPAPNFNSIDAATRSYGTTAINTSWTRNSGALTPFYIGGVSIYRTVNEASGYIGQTFAGPVTLTVKDPWFTAFTGAGISATWSYNSSTVISGTVLSWTRPDPYAPISSQTGSVTIATSQTTAPNLTNLTNLYAASLVVSGASSTTPINIYGVGVTAGSSVTLTISPTGLDIPLGYFSGKGVTLTSRVFPNRWISGNCTAYNKDTGSLTITITRSSEFTGDPTTDFQAYNGVEELIGSVASPWSFTGTTAGGSSGFTSSVPVDPIALVPVAPGVGLTVGSTKQNSTQRYPYYFAGWVPATALGNLSGTAGGPTGITMTAYNAAATGLGITGIAFMNPGVSNLTSFYTTARSWVLDSWNVTLPPIPGAITPGNNNVFQPSGWAANSSAGLPGGSATFEFTNSWIGPSTAWNGLTATIYAGNITSPPTTNVYLRGNIFSNTSVSSNTSIVLNITESQKAIGPWDIRVQSNANDVMFNDGYAKVRIGVARTPISQGIPRSPSLDVFFGNRIWSKSGYSYQQYASPDVQTSYFKPGSIISYSRTEGVQGETLPLKRVIGKLDEYSFMLSKASANTRSANEYSYTGGSDGKGAGTTVVTNQPWIMLSQKDWMGSNLSEIDVAGNWSVGPFSNMSTWYNLYNKDASGYLELGPIDGYQGWSDATTAYTSQLGTPSTGAYIPFAQLVLEKTVGSATAASNAGWTGINMATGNARLTSETYNDGGLYYLGDTANGIRQLVFGISGGGYTPDDPSAAAVATGGTVGSGIALLNVSSYVNSFTGTTSGFTVTSASIPSLAYGQTSTWLGLPARWFRIQGMTASPSNISTSSGPVRYIPAYNL
jgi:hypothetical protein